MADGHGIRLCIPGPTSLVWKVLILFLWVWEAIKMDRAKTLRRERRGKILLSPPRSILLLCLTQSLCWISSHTCRKEMTAMLIGAYVFWLASGKQNFKMTVTNRTLWDCYKDCPCMFLCLSCPLKKCQDKFPCLFCFLLMCCDLYPLDLQAHGLVLC